MKVFLTGATGYLGWHVGAALRRAGHQVVGLVRSEVKARRLWAAEIEPVVGTMDQPESYARYLAGCGAVVHTAVDYAGDTFALDRRTVEAVLAARPGKFLYTSGTWVYGDTGGTTVDESTVPRPMIRVAGKLDSERLALASTVPAVVLRPGNVYGQQGGMFADWFEPLERGEAPTIVGDGKSRWPLIHVDDLADGYLRAVESPCHHEVINLTDRSRETVTEMVEAASAAAGYPGAPSYLSVAEAAKTMGSFAECLALDQQVDSSKAARLLGWQPRHRGFVDQARTYYEAWRANR